MYRSPDLTACPARAEQQSMSKLDEEQVPAQMHTIILALSTIISVGNVILSLCAIHELLYDIQNFSLF